MQNMSTIASREQYHGISAWKESYRVESISSKETLLMTYILRAIIHKQQDLYFYFRYPLEIK